MQWIRDFLCLLMAEISALIWYLQASQNAFWWLPSTFFNQPLKLMSSSQASLKARLGGIYGRTIFSFFSTSMYLFPKVDNIVLIFHRERMHDWTSFNKKMEKLYMVFEHLMIPERCVAVHMYKFFCNLILYLLLQQPSFNYHNLFSNWSQIVRGFFFF